MKYRIKERVNRINDAVSYAVERQICETPDNWMLCSYISEMNVRRYAVFEKKEDAENFVCVCANPVEESIVWEGEA